VVVTPPFVLVADTSMIGRRRTLHCNKEEVVSLSPVFEDMFSVPVPCGGVVEGESEHTPIFLEGYKSVDFERFLAFLDPSLYVQ
jgi:hypothetical protein